jgi:predicted small lipoprotein YifL
MEGAFGMKFRVMLVVALVALAGCGADGDPIPPEKDEPTGPGVSFKVNGKVEMGITG